MRRLHPNLGGEGSFGVIFAHSVCEKFEKVLASMISYMTTETKNRKKVRKFSHRVTFAVEGGGAGKNLVENLVYVIFQKKCEWVPEFRRKNFGKKIGGS